MTEKRSRTSGEPATDHFWEHELELSLDPIRKKLEDRSELEGWLAGLTGRQVKMLCTLLGVDGAGTVRSTRPMLRNAPDRLVPFYVAAQFGRNKSNVAVAETARDALPPELLDVARIADRKEAANGDGDEREKFDRTTLLFALFHRDPALLKEVMHFAIVHKVGFAAMVLKGSIGDGGGFVPFLKGDKAAKVLADFDGKQGDHCISELCGVTVKESRPFVFIRRTERPDHIHDGKRLVHGHRIEWIVLDFSPDAHQVNIASKSVAESLGIADAVAQAYFGKHCRYENERKACYSKQIKRFISEVRAGRAGIGLVEVCVGDSPLRGAAKVRLSHEASESLNESLTHFDETVGPLLNSLPKVEGIKVLYRNKRVGLSFEPDDGEADKYVVRYTDHRLNMVERRLFEQEMRDAHGLPVLSTEKRFRNEG